jgi:RNA polymerase sigma-70 factor (ECF subfamily)
MEDNELIILIKDKDEKAFFELIERYEKKAYGIAFGILRRSEDAKDAAQEAFVKVWQKIHDFDQRSRFSTWFYRIVVNTSLDKTRKWSWNRTVPLQRPGEEKEIDIKAEGKEYSPTDALLNKELGEKIRQALDILPLQQKAVFTLRHQEGMSTKQVSEIMNISEGAVKAHLSRAVNKLKQVLAPYVSERGR